MFQAETSDRLIADDLQAHSAHTTIGRQIIVLQETSSTNDAILRPRLQIQTKAWFYLPNIKLPGVVSVATGGNRLRAKAFGFPFFCGQEFKSTSLAG